ncbi:MAG: rhomboid family intramembrane serine protease [Sphingobacteriales bacterium]|nr:rhomboid family intramembrane serine protease [Sphingobacteriales bacterium]
MEITYNSPAVLTFSLICTGITLADYTLPGISEAFFSVSPGMSWLDPLSYFRLISHTIGHGGWGHLFGNLTLILLLGPMLEEKYGTKNLVLMMTMTSLVTVLLNITLFSTGLMGASGIVFMFILLSSLTNFKSGHIPLTFLLVVGIFLGNEILNILNQNDGISQFAHIIGGVCGSVFGFRTLPPASAPPPIAPTSDIPTNDRKNDYQPPNFGL